METTVVTGDGVPLHVRSAGDGASPVVPLHLEQSELLVSLVDGSLRPG